MDYSLLFERVGHDATTWDEIWDPEETYTDPEILLDMGCPQGTDLKELCDLVGTAAGDKIRGHSY
jgi:hypothetical protein